MHITTLSGHREAINETEIEQFRMSMRGPLLRPEDAAYQEARVIFNGMFDARPALIARCQRTADVIDAVRFAKRFSVLTAIRAGGHSVAGYSTCEGGLVIDVSPMNGVMVDHARQTVRVQGGATWGDVDRETQLFGLATPGGIVSHTGVAGLALNGGIGWLRNKYGLTCDNLIAADVVTASGDVLTVNANENTDLFWALRGGGGNFGVVTSFEFALHPVGPLLAVVFSIYPISSTRDVLKQWREWVESASDDVTTEIITWTAPVGSALPPSVQGCEIVIAAGVYAGDAETGMRELQPLREFGKPLGEIVAALPYCALQSAFDGSLPNTGVVIAYWKSLHLKILSDAAIDIMADRAEKRSSPSTMVFVQHLGGAVRRMGSRDTAFPVRDCPFVVNFMGDWRNLDETPRHIEWVRDAWRRMAPQSTGAVYLNYSGREERDSHAMVRDAFGGNYDQLVKIKTKYDPANLFRLNQNLRPRQAE